jgi:L-lactate permease
VVSRLKGVLQAGSGPQIVQQAVKRGMDATPGILFMVAMAATLDHAGMLPILAQTLASVTGRAFPLVSPLIGAVGAFVREHTNSMCTWGAARDIANAVCRAVILAAQMGRRAWDRRRPAKVIPDAAQWSRASRGEVMRHLLKYALAALGVLALLTWALRRESPSKKGQGFWMRLEPSFSACRITFVSVNEITRNTFAT